MEDKRFAIQKKLKLRALSIYALLKAQISAYAYIYIKKDECWTS